MSYRLTHRIAAIVITCLFASEAFACEPRLYDPVEFAKADTPLKLATDGSFENASAQLMEIGHAVRDRGNMRIAQRLEYRGVCGPSEALLVVDCSTADLIVLHGKPGPDSFSLGGALSTTIQQIQKPLGPIDVTSEVTIPELIEIAKKNDIDYYTDFISRQKQEKRKNRYDAYYGCKLFYPDSVGASMPKP
jgi:hypothetical protein